MPFPRLSGKATMQTAEPAGRSSPGGIAGRTACGASWILLLCRHAGYHEGHEGRPDVRALLFQEPLDGWYPFPHGTRGYVPGRTHGAPQRVQGETAPACGAFHRTPNRLGIHLRGEGEGVRDGVR